MMHKYCFLIIFVLLTSCMSTEVVDIELPFTEYTVIYGELPLSEAFTGINISKTIPLNMPYHASEATIDDAVVYIKLNNIDIIPLLNYGSGNYYPYNSIYASEGDFYQLFIDINGKNYYGETIIPKPPVAKSIRVENDIVYLEIFGNADESYGAIWAYFNEFNALLQRSDNFYSVVESQGNNSTISLRTKAIADSTQDLHTNDKLGVIIYAFGKNYSNYYNSKAGNTSIENALTQGGTAIYTNIAGEYVIGAFTGSAKSVYFTTNLISNQ